MPRVLNIRDLGRVEQAVLKREGHVGNLVYVGRRRGPHHFGNPFTHLTDPTLAVHTVSTRERAIEAYAQWLDGTHFRDVEPIRRDWIRMQLMDDELAGKDLVCWCSPLACHADILLTLSNTDS
jgi:hypothetical protein